MRICQCICQQRSLRTDSEVGNVLLRTSRRRACMLACVLADLIDLSLHQRRGDMEGLKLQKQLLETQNPEKMIDLKETPLKKHGGYTQEEHIAIFESQIAGLGV